MTNQLFDQAMAGPNRDLWRTAMEEEISAQEENGTWVIEKPPKGAKKIGSRWVLKRKRNRRNYIRKYKGRIVAKGCSQIEGVHFGETFAPTLRMQSLRIILAYAAYKGWSLRQLDVKTAFLIPTLPDSEVIYMTPPPLVEVPEGMALKLKRCLYGLRQASRRFYEHMSASLKELGFTVTNADNCLYTHYQLGNITAILGLFVDDIILAGTINTCDKLADSLMSRYKMTDAGTPSYLLGIAIDHDTVNGKVSLSQEAYCHRLLETYNMSNCKTVKTPAAVLRLTAGDLGHPLRAT